MQEIFVLPAHSISFFQFNCRRSGSSQGKDHHTDARERNHDERAERAPLPQSSHFRRRSIQAGCRSSAGRVARRKGSADRRVERGEGEAAVTN